MFTYDIETWQRISEKMIKTQWKNKSLWIKPAFQIAIYTENNENDILKTLMTVDAAMLNFNKECKWILHIGDGDSSDRTLEKIELYSRKTNADKIHIYDFDKEDKRGVNENKLIRELHKYGEEYPAVLFMEAGGEMLPERPYMFYTAASYNTPYVVGAWTSSRIDSAYYTSDDAAFKLFFGPWATLFHISALPKEEPLFYETINKGRDVLAWTQMRYIQNINPVAHVRSTDIVHVYHHTDELDPDNFGTQASFVKQEKASGEIPSNKDVDFTSLLEKEALDFLKIKSKLEKRDDILKYVERT